MYAFICIHFQIIVICVLSTKNLPPGQTYCNKNVMIFRVHFYVGKNMSHNYTCMSCTYVFNDSVCNITTLGEYCSEEHLIII